jgi:hypothetical protein
MRVLVRNDDVGAAARLRLQRTRDADSIQAVAALLSSLTPAKSLW